MAVNKVEFGDQVVMDITDSTVSPEKLLSGETAYDKSGAKITGSLVTKDISIETKRSTGENIATVTIDGTDHDIYALSEEEVADFLSGDQEAEGNPVTLKTLIGGKAIDCEASFGPVQDLHGYNSPWIGGAGKNKIPISEWFTAGETKVQDGITLTFLANGKIEISGTNTSSSATMLYLSNAASNPPYNVWTVPSGQYTLSWNGISNTDVNLITSGGGNNGFEYTSLSSSSKTKTSTVSNGTKPFNYLIIQVGAGVQIPSNSVLEIQLEQGATATAWAPYENTCPITGRTNLKLLHTNKNLMIPSYTNGNYFGGTDQKQRHITNLIKIKQGKTYTFSSDNYEDYDYLLCSSRYDTIPFVGNIYNYCGTSMSYASQDITFTATKDGWLGVIIRKSTAFDEGEIDTIKMQIEESSSATNFVNCLNDIKNIAFGDAYYGGKIKWNADGSCEVAIDKFLYTFTGNESWIKQSGLNNKYYTSAFIFRELGALLPANNYLSVPIITSVGDFNYSYVGLETHPYSMCIAADGRVGITADLKKTSDTLQGEQICYTKRVPQVIALTPDEIDLLKGINVLWTDGDEVYITWQNIPDIEKLIGNTIEGTLTAGSTSLTLQSNKITEDSTFDIYTDKYGVNPTDITVTNGQAVLIFESQSTDLKVKVKVM